MLARSSLLLILLIGLSTQVQAQTPMQCQEQLLEVLDSFARRDLRTKDENIKVFSKFLTETRQLPTCDKLKVTLTRILANIYLENGEYNKTDSLCTLALQIDKARGDSIGIAKNYGIKTWLAAERGQSLKGVEYAEKALNIISNYPKENFIFLEHQLSINKAINLVELNRLEQARAIYQKIIDDSLAHISNVQLSLQGLGNIAFKQSLFENALKHYKDLYAYYEKEKDMVNLAHLDLSIGQTLMKLQDTLSAKSHFEKSVMYATKTESELMQKFGLLELLTLPRHLFSQQELQQIKSKLIELSQKTIGSSDDEKDVFMEIMIDYVEANKNSEALLLLEEYSSTKVTNSFNFLEVYPDVKKKVERAQLMRVVGLFVLLIVAGIFFLNYVRKRDAEIAKEKMKKQALKEKNKLLGVQLENEILIKEKEKQALREKNALQELDHAEAILKTEFDLREESAQKAHDLKGTVAGLRNGLDALVSYYDTNIPQKTELARLHKDANSLSEQMRNLSRELDPKPGEWLDSLKRMLDQLEKDTSIKTSIRAENIMDRSITSYIGHRVQTILRVLIDNVKEHARASSLHIETLKDENQLNILVKDDGKGGFRYPQDEGVGLKSVRKKINDINGQLSIDTSQGTSVSISIPLE